MDRTTTRTTNGLGSKIFRSGVLMSTKEASLGRLRSRERSLSILRIIELVRLDLFECCWPVKVRDILHRVVVSLSIARDRIVLIARALWQAAVPGVRGSLAVVASLALRVEYVWYCHLHDSSVVLIKSDDGRMKLIRNSYFLLDYC